MNSSPIYKTCLQPLNVKLPAYAPNEKLAFVERVCSLLVESRFTEPRPYRSLIHLTDEPERAEHIFFEMTCEGPMPSYLIDLFDETIRSVIGDLCDRRIGIFAELPQFASPQNAARGSPRVPNERQRLEWRASQTTTLSS